MVESSVQMISVEVLAHNVLGRSESDTYNFTLSDIGMEATGHPLITLFKPYERRSTAVFAMMFMFIDSFDQASSGYTRG
jgi:hypothetical protein